MKKALIVGNCQADAVSQCLTLMTDELEFHAAKPIEIESGSYDPDFDLIMVQKDLRSRVYRAIERRSDARKQHLIFPSVYFTAFHPDFVYATENGKLFAGTLGNTNSAILVYGWKHGFSVDEVLNLFQEDVYNELGYFDHWDRSHDDFLRDSSELGMDLEAELLEWRQSGCFVHCPNHPKPPVIAGISRAILARMGIRPKISFPERIISDPFSKGLVWPIYPEIADRFGLQGEMLFRGGEMDKNAKVGANCYDLERYVSKSFERWAEVDPSNVQCSMFNNGKLDVLHKFRNVKKPAVIKKSPYSEIAVYQRWKLGVANVSPADLDPVVTTKFKISKQDAVAAAGSCFAQHIAKSLARSGFRYIVSEVDDSLPASEAARRNYGVFSARYGNIYSARQLLQLFERAAGTFRPLDDAWQRPDGRWVDPFRPQIEPDGFADLDGLRESRESHFEAVNSLWRSANVFVFTLGLTETWVNRRDGAAFPIAPGVVAGSFDDTRYKLHNMSVQDTVEDLRAFIVKLRLANPKIRVVLTVSPVPLIATAESKHVLVATTYSKAVLRAAAEEVAMSDSLVDYFPSFEIITGSYSRGSYLADDLREVKPEGVEHVMRVFLKHYTQGLVVQKGPILASAANPDLINHIRSSSSIVCDEEVIEASIAQ